MARHESDRRRFLLATIVTLLALPALWWANRDESGAPSVASVGVDVGGNAPAIGAAPDAESNVVASVEPVFLDGPTTGNGGVGDIAVPAKPEVAPLTGTASYSSAIYSVDSCFAKSFRTGTTISVVNLNNNRSITCVVTRAPDAQDVELVVSTKAYLELADLTDAPIPVEIGQ